MLTEDHCFSKPLHVILYIESVAPTRSAVDTSSGIEVLRKDASSFPVSDLTF